jgi:hypothetical protein
MRDIASLRKLADHARRLARSINDPDAIARLESFAEETDKEIEKLEPTPQSRRPRSAPR